MRLEVLTTGVFVLLSSVGIACGSSYSADTQDGGSSRDGSGSAGDAGAAGDSANTADSASTGDSASSGDSASASDGQPITEGGSAVSPQEVDLGSAGTYAILAMSGISTVPTSAITGDLGVSPAQATAITGFTLMADASNVFSTSTQVTGKVYAPGYASPTPANLTAAIGAMKTAYTDAAGRAPDVTELGAGTIGGMTLPRGVYKWSSGLDIPTSITLSGSATDVWIFQIAQNLQISNAMSVELAGGAVPEHVFWQVAGAVEIGTTAQFEGIVLSQTGIALETGASIHGRLMAQTAVTLESSTVDQPAH